MQDESITTAEVAAILKVAESTVRGWRAQGLGPAYYRLTENENSDVRYLRSSIDAYIKKQMIQPS